MRERESIWELERSGLRGGGGGRRVLVWCVEKGKWEMLLREGEEEKNVREI